jgi:DNA-binding transcriptional MerR regulator
MSFDGELIKGFTGPQTCKIVGISYRQLDYWTRTGIISPSLAQAKGSGSRRLYSYKDLLELKVIKRLIEAGIALSSIKKAVKYLRNELSETLGQVNLVIHGPDVFVASDSEELFSILKGGQGVMNVLSIGPLIKELGNAIGWMPEGWPQELFSLDHAVSS